MGAHGRHRPLPPFFAIQFCAKHAPSAGIGGVGAGGCGPPSHLVVIAFAFICEKKSPGEADLQEDARLAVYTLGGELGEDANGELWMRGHGDG